MVMPSSRARIGYQLSIRRSYRQRHRITGPHAQNGGRPTKGAEHGRSGHHQPGARRADRPVGAFILRDGELTWRPAIDVTRIAIGGQVVAIVALLAARAIFKSWAKTKH
jgi:hypothetical protein